MRALRRLLAAAGLALLAGAALLGVALSAAFLLVSTEAGRALLVPRLLAAANAGIAGRLSLEGFEVGRAGGVELRGVRLLDPGGEPVAEVDRIGGVVDLSRLRSRRVSLRLDADGPRLFLRRGPDGRLNLEAALAPRRPRAARPAGPSPWTVRLARLAVRGGAFEWRDGATRVRADGLSLDARALQSPRGSRVEAALRGTLREPEEGALALELRAGLAGGRLSLPVLRASFGDSAVELVADGQPAARRGRVAALSLRLAGGELERLDPAARLASLAARAYAEADGTVATAALDVRPAGGPGGGAEAGLALLLPPAAPAVGFHLRADGVDPARVTALLPAGELHLAALGHAAGRDLASLRGRLRLSLAPSRLRQGRVGPAELQARADGDGVEITRLEAALPGATLRGRGRWRPRGTAAGSLAADLPDLDALTRDLRALGIAAPPLRGSARGEASFDGRDARVSLSALLPELGPEPFAASAAGTLAPDRRSLAVREGTLSWPGARFTLEAPARVALQGPSVDRLALRSGDQRIAVEGGLAKGLLDLRVHAERLDLARVPARLLPEGLGLAGRASLDAELRGRPRAPLASAHAAVEGGTVRGLGAVEATADLRLDGPARRGSAALSAAWRDGEVPAAVRARLDLEGGRARLAAAADGAGQHLLDAEADAPLDAAALLRDPGAALRALRRAPIALRATVPGIELAPLAAQGLLPAGVAGRLTASAELSGPASAPRGTIRAEVAGGAAGGWRGLALQASATAREAAVDLTARAAAGSEELLAATASLGLPPERLLDRAARDGAALRGEVTARGVDLARLAGPVALVGRASLRLEAGGRLGAPELSLAASGTGVGVGERPLGDLQASAHAGARGLGAEALFRASTGGTVRGSIEARAAVTPAAVASGALAGAPIHARVEADALDLSFLPVLLPGLVRSAAGRLDARVEADGTLRSPRPRGTLRVAGGHAAVAGLGEWHGLEVEASADEDSLVLSRLEARRGDGRLDAHAALRGLSRPGAPGDLTGALTTTGLLLSWEGQELVTLDLDARLKGTAGAAGLDADVEVLGGQARLPRRTPRSLQPLEPPRDIVVVGTGRPRSIRTAPARPWPTSVRVLLPGSFRVVGDQPRADVVLRGELRLTRDGGPLLADGRIEAPSGFFEESGRLFTIRRAVVAFPGGEVSEGTVDAEATYDNPVARVTIAVTGPVESPAVKMTSEPPLDEGQIAMLIVTGRTEVKAGSGAAGPPTGTDAGYALLGTVATQALRSTLRDKLPVDLVTFDSGQIRMGKYLGDKFYVGYTRRFNANPELGENPNEVRVEYELSPRWTLETRYGDANTGSASLFWTKDY